MASAIFGKKAKERLMKCHRTRNLNKAEQEAFEREISRQMAEWMEQHEFDIDKVVLYVLHKHFGFGYTRLKRFWKHLRLIEDELKQAYGDISTWDFLADISLKDIGVDVEAWEREIQIKKEKGKTK